MNYHGGVENYYKAKITFSNSKSSRILPFVILFNAKIPIKKNEVHLIGDHNIKNIKVATKVAKIFKISDQTIKSS